MELEVAQQVKRSSSQRKLGSILTLTLVFDFGRRSIQKSKIKMDPSFRWDDVGNIHGHENHHASAISDVDFALALPRARSSRLATSSQARALASMMSLLVPVPSYSSPS